jgi:hypothetical protein
VLGPREFRVGDRVLCRRNDAQLGVRNGTRATLAGFHEASLTLRTDDGMLRNVPVGYAAKHLDHGYAFTGHAAQGVTLERAFVLFRAQGALQEWGYVACSRARTETRLYLTADTLEPLAHPREATAEHLPERAARALTASSAESLALDQAEPIAPAIARVHAARRRQLEQTRTCAERRLAEAREQLDRLGWRGRRQHGPELRAEIAMQQTALRLADEQLASCATIAPSRIRPTAAGRERGLSTHARELEKQTVAQVRARSLILERGFGPEL